MRDELLELRRQVQSCKKCELWEGRYKPVFGEGHGDAEIVLIGLGPGYHENLEGRPFIGAAGKLLDELLALAGLKRESVYITNVVKCYLPDNKATDEEIRACTPYLNKQIEIIDPKTIVLLGNVATKCVFNRFALPLASMRNLHGKIISVSTLFLQTKIIPMYHPAAALRNPGLKGVVRNDWKNIGESLKPLK